MNLKSEFRSIPGWIWASADIEMISAHMDKQIPPGWELCEEPRPSAPKDELLFLIREKSEEHMKLEKQAANLSEALDQLHQEMHELKIENRVLKEILSGRSTS